MTAEFAGLREMLRSYRVFLDEMPGHYRYPPGRPVDRVVAYLQSARDHYRRRRRHHRWWYDRQREFLAALEVT